MGTGLSSYEKRFFGSQNLVNISWNSKMRNTLKLFYGLSFLQFWRLGVKNNIFIQLSINFQCCLTADCWPRYWDPQCKNTPPRRLTASFPLVCDYIAGKPVMVSRYVGCFLRLVGGGGWGGTGYLRSNISPFHYLEKSPSFPRDIRRTSQVWWKYRENLPEISYASPDYWTAAEN